jgi:hypothetical protein
MKLIILPSAIAFMIAMLGVTSGLTARPISKKQQAEDACEATFQACFDTCDKAPNTTRKIYNTCVAVCAHEYYHCTPYSRAATRSRR